MTQDLVNKKIGEFSLLDGFIITGSKIATEEVLAKVPFIGNGTYKSGAYKVGGAFLTSMVSKQKFVQYAASGLLIDGAEDILANIKAQFKKVNGSNGINNGEVIL